MSLYASNLESLVAARPEPGRAIAPSGKGGPDGSRDSFGPASLRTGAELSRSCKSPAGSRPWPGRCRMTLSSGTPAWIVVWRSERKPEKQKALWLSSNDSGEISAQSTQGRGGRSAPKPQPKERGPPSPRVPKRTPATGGLGGPRSVKILAAREHSDGSQCGCEGRNSIHPLGEWPVVMKSVFIRVQPGMLTQRTRRSAQRSAERSVLGVLCVESLDPGAKLRLPRAGSAASLRSIAPPATGELLLRPAAATSGQGSSWPGGLAGPRSVLYRP